MSSLSEKALKKGAVLKGSKRSYVIEETLVEDSQGFTYSAKTLSGEVTSGPKNAKDGQLVVVREQFMGLCSDRGDDGMSVVTPEDISPTVDDCLKGFREASNMRSRIAATHPAIINVLECFEANNTYYYVVEYLSGQTLEEYVNETGPLSFDDAMALLSPIFQAAERFHRQHTMHTDITPRHIRFTNVGENKKPVLFNLYNTMHFNEEGVKIWTVQPSTCDDGYAAPEQYGEMEHFTPQTDIYSLAATLVFALTGKPVPDSRILDEDTLRAFLPPALPETYVSALVHALASDIADRTVSVQDFLQELDVHSNIHPSLKRKAEGIDDDDENDSAENDNQIGRRMIWMGILTLVAIGVALWIASNLV